MFNDSNTADALNAAYQHENAVLTKKKKLTLRELADARRVLRSEYRERLALILTNAS